MAQASANNKCVLGMSLFVSVYGIVQHFTGVVPTEAWVDNDAFPELKTRVISTLVNPNILGGYLVLVISLITSCLVQVKKNVAAGTWQRNFNRRALFALHIFTWELGCFSCWIIVVLRMLLPSGFIASHRHWYFRMWFARGAVWHRIISILGLKILLLLLDLPIWKVRYLLLKNIRGVLAGMDISLFIRNMIFILTILTSLCIIVIIYY